MKSYNGIMGTKIDRCKELADPAKYLGLFRKHLPELEDDGAGKKIALVDISSIEVECNLARMYPKAEIHVFDNDFTYECVQIICAGISIIGHDVKIDEHMYNMIGDMKFDVVVGNPPYERNLHLKILSETMKHVDFENGGEIVWLAPVRWLQDPYIEWHGSKQEIEIRHKCVGFLVNVENFDVETSNNVFQIAWAGIFGITVWKKTNINIDPASFSMKDPLVRKILDKSYSLPSLRSMFGKNNAFAFSVKVRRRTHRLLPFADNNSNATQVVSFQTVEERDNFIAACDWKKFKLWNWLNDYRWDGLDNSAEFPFMQDYTQPWTDARFYKFFELTPEEIKRIEETVKDVQS